MIEIESKFDAEKINLQEMLKRAKHVKSERILDEYADTADFALVRNKLRLRRRNGEWQLKIGMKNNLTPEGIKSYEEVEGEEKVACSLEEITKKNLREMQTFAEIRKFRQKFLLGEFIIDLDIANFGPSVYEVKELELLVEEENQRAEAEEKIRRFAEENKLVLGKPRGMLMEYLHRHNNELYKKLKILKKEANSGKI